MSAHPGAAFLRARAATRRFHAGAGTHKKISNGLIFSQRYINDRKLLM